MDVNCLFGSLCFTAKEKSDLKLWFSTPADATVADSPNGWDDDKEWVKALPLGNGSLGAMVFGDVNQERIQLMKRRCGLVVIRHVIIRRQLNIWTNQRAVICWKFKEATELTNWTQICRGVGSGHGNGSTVPFGCYQTLGDLWIDFGNKGKFFLIIVVN